MREAEFGFDTHRVGLFDVEHDPRRTGTRIERGLQVLDVVVEARDIGVEPASIGLGTDLVIPQRLVVIALERAEERRIGW